ncbi:SusD/RagB family nutrient-binding outer membrane lipoprotein [Spirosoma validum]|uniref:SusD/RagB family nutrient-binding outer membrane lipoprotein n=1 Tax=Spirosoma validum TaxID=2771355 RepID=A0A927B7Z7_9BACT|nr:SusD/RagB family nutrient-binding outer membrane lipoprotein [Spirosoma validum]MBD2756872.1 SusD/RagB family nutrient-binding outer membrane lipoprotein [Spirosoma validum]
MTFKLKLAPLLTALVLISSSCDTFLDINTSPNNLLTAPISQVLTSAAVNVGFTGGSDLSRFSNLLVQQFAGQAGPGTQTSIYQTYVIQPTDVNNVYGSIYATTLSDLDYVISNSTGSPHYSGIAKILKAYSFQQVLDTFGDIPYTEAGLGTANTQPKFDDDEQVYRQLFTLLDQGISEVSATQSALSPTANDVIFAGDRTKWAKFANTLKLRLLLHYSEKDNAYLKQQMTALIGSNVQFMQSNSDNFQMTFGTDVGKQNPIYQFDVSRADYLFPNSFLVNLMNTNTDPRRPRYFTPFPYTTNLAQAQYKGSTPGDDQSINYSRFGEYLFGARTNTTTTITPNAQGGITSTVIQYSGSAPVRMLTFAEYNFIRAEAALRFQVTGDAQTFYQAGIRASMQAAGVADADITSYLARRGTLTGTAAQQLQQLIEEKYVANLSVSVENWTDWRRTGYPAIRPVANGVITQIPRVLYYPQSETDRNLNTPKRASLTERVFWDTRQ